MNTIKQYALFSVVVGSIFGISSLISGCSQLKDGDQLFISKGCSQCHSFKGIGGQMGPDLTAVTNRRSDKWIENYLQDPKAVNPNARMPSFKNLSRAQREAIIAFLKK